MFYFRVLGRRRHLGQPPPQLVWQPFFRCCLLFLRARVLFLFRFFFCCFGSFLFGSFLVSFLFALFSNLRLRKSLRGGLKVPLARQRAVLLPLCCFTSLRLCAACALLCSREQPLVSAHARFYWFFICDRRMRATRRFFWENWSVVRCASVVACEF